MENMGVKECALVAKPVKDMNFVKAVIRKIIANTKLSTPPKKMAFKPKVQIYISGVIGGVANHAGTQ